MKELATYTARDGNKAKVFRVQDGGFVVKFYNHRGAHMDASDYHTGSLDDAKAVAQVATGMVL